MAGGHLWQAGPGRSPGPCGAVWGRSPAPGRARARLPGYRGPAAAAMVKETIRVYARVKPLGRRQQAGVGRELCSGGHHREGGESQGRPGSRVPRSGGGSGAGPCPSKGSGERRGLKGWFSGCAVPALRSLRKFIKTQSRGV